MNIDSELVRIRMNSMLDGRGWGSLSISDSCGRLLSVQGESLFPKGHYSRVFDGTQAGLWLALFQIEWDRLMDGMPFRIKEDTSKEHRAAVAAFDAEQSREKMRYLNGVYEYAMTHAPPISAEVMSAGECETATAIRMIDESWD